MSRPRAQKFIKLKVFTVSGQKVIFSHSLTHILSLVKIQEPKTKSPSHIFAIFFISFVYDVYEKVDGFNMQVFDDLCVSCFVSQGGE